MKKIIVTMQSIFHVCFFLTLHLLFVYFQVAVLVLSIQFENITKEPNALFTIAIDGIDNKQTSVVELDFFSFSLFHNVEANGIDQTNETNKYQFNNHNV